MKCPCCGAKMDSAKCANCGFDILNEPCVCIGEDITLSSDQVLSILSNKTDSKNIKHSDDDNGNYNDNDNDISQSMADDSNAIKPLVEIRPQDQDKGENKQPGKGSKKLIAIVLVCIAIFASGVSCFILSNSIVDKQREIEKEDQNSVDLDEQTDEATGDTYSADGTIHYYYKDLEQTGDGFDGSFGPNYWNEIGNEKYETQLSKASEEFYTRLQRDPVMAAACFGYIDRNMGTSYTGKYFASISDDWISELNNTTYTFINDKEQWINTTQAVIKLLRNSAASIDEVKGGNVKSFFIEDGIMYPMLTTGSYKWDEDTVCHSLTFNINIKGTIVKLSYLIESGFSPILG